VFSSGSFDGWSAGGVASNDSAAGLYSFLIEGKRNIHSPFNSNGGHEGVGQWRGVGAAA
jgi:hypothetical protein